MSVIDLIEAAASSNAEFLDLGNCGLTEIPAEIDKVSRRLKRLNLGTHYVDENGYKDSAHTGSLNNFSKAPHFSRLESLKGLQSLSLYNTQIAAEQLFVLKQLRSLSSLDVGGNQLGDTGAEVVSRLRQLTSLDIDDNGLTDKGALSIGKLSELTSLGISNNGLTDEGTMHIAGLRRLIALDISLNQVGNAGLDALKNLKHLTSLSIHSNRIDDDGLVNIGRLEKLSSLYIYGNGLTSRGASYIASLTNLFALGISDNEIGNAGAGYLSQITTLRTLEIAFNGLSAEGAEAIARLSQLGYLDIAKNPIKDEGAMALAALSQLSVLNIESTEITDKSVRYIFHNIDTLTAISLMGNQFALIPMEILNDFTALRAYLNSSKQVDNTLVKMILIGNTTAGKSKLAEFLSSDHFADNSESTHGIKLWKWATHLAGQPLQVNIWDFGGQDYYHATHNIFLDDKTLYLLLHIPKEIHAVHADEKQYLPDSYWLGNITNLARNQTPIWYIQSKSDLAAPQYLNTSLLQRYNVCRQYSISVKRSADKDHRFSVEFDYFRQNLLSELSNLAKGKLPVSWVAIRDKYLPQWRIKKLYLTVDEFKSHCFEALASDPIFLEDLRLTWEGILQYMKGCGEIIYFPNIDSLSTIIFLSAEELTNGIFKLLSKEALASNGYFTLSPTDEERVNQALFLQVLLAYELVFEKPGSQGIYIAPQYLPENPHTKYFQELMQVAYVIRFPHYMSRSVITRFLVKYGGSAADNYYWKYGSFFKLHRLNVFVRIEAEKQRVSVHVEEGNSNDRFAAMKDLFQFFAYSSYRRSTVEVETQDNIKDRSQLSSNADWLNQVPGEIELSVDGVNFAPIEALKEAVDNKSYKIKSVEGGYVEFNAILHQLLSKSTVVPKKVFLSYSHKDEEYKKELDVHFAALKRSGKVETWNDRAIMAGDDWDKSIRTALNEADIALLLLSPDFMASDYIWNTEIPHAIKRGVRIVPIFVRHCDFKDSAFELYARQGLPADVKWIVSREFVYRDEAYLLVINGIKALLDG